MPTMTTHLTPADWTTRESLARLAAALGPDTIRWVGGCVRDTLLGFPVNDIDCATTHHPGKVIDLCREAGIRAVPTGIDHGTVTAVLEDGPVEITTLRRDVSTDGRRATVAFASDWREDAARRDFTINALYAHPETLEIDDYFGGLADLQARRVRFIGDAHERIREDHLRILRYFRFQARFGADLDAEATAACEKLAQTLKGISRERVAMELLGILALPDPAATVQLMAQLGVLAVILPEAHAAEIAALERLVAAENSQQTEGHPIRRLAALIPPVPTVAEALAARLRLSRAQRNRLVCAAERKPGDADAPFALAWREGVDCARDRLLLAGANIAALGEWTPPLFPMKGGEIVQRGVAAGPRVAQIMQTAQNRWIDEGFPDRDRVSQIVDELIAEL